MLVVGYLLHSTDVDDNPQSNTHNNNMSTGGASCKFCLGKFFAIALLSRRFFIIKLKEENIFKQVLRLQYIPDLELNFDGGEVLQLAYLLISL